MALNCVPFPSLYCPYKMDFCVSQPCNFVFVLKIHGLYSSFTVSASSLTHLLCAA